MTDEQHKKAFIDDSMLAADIRDAFLRDKKQNVPEQLRNVGVIELAALTGNQSLTEYMKHWESRAEKAESEVAALQRQVDVLCEELSKHARCTVEEARNRSAAKAKEVKT